MAHRMCLTGCLRLAAVVRFVTWRNDQGPSFIVRVLSIYFRPCVSFRTHLARGRGLGGARVGTGGRQNSFCATTYVVLVVQIKTDIEFRWEF